ncbi:uncharacterized protein LOC105779053 [Gossypium raimondii]|uniref:uncharacterized protein LOC105779053 n=1 Tax=Gossypium raimondii TaxID=29730 RepID=UPI00063AFC36|nr:uncharacterized protein LOC105779053 [Gossypium raimondii]
MSTKSGARGRGRGRGSIRVGFLASGHMPNVEATGDDALSQVMLRILERVVGPNNSSGSRGSISERLQSSGAKIFKGIARVTPNVAEYWLEATERIMADLDCTSEKKLKGAVSLLREEAYQWWLTVKEGTHPDRGRKFFNLTKRDRSVEEYEAEFLRLSRYAKRIVATDYERCVLFEDGLRDSLRVLIAPQRERDSTALVEKAKIAKDVNRTECLN